MEDKINPSVIGVDVAKEKVDCHHLPSNETKIFANNETGFKEFIAWAKKRNPEIVLCEHTGGYERAFTIAVASAGLPVTAKNPLHIRMFARSFGIYAKSDKNDAKVIARFAAERKPKAMQPVSAQQVTLKELIASRRQLVVVRIQLKNQLELVQIKTVIKGTKKILEQVDKQIKCVETEMEKILADNEEWTARKEILKSVPGIGNETARTLLIECPELGSGDADKISCLVGVAPLTWDSGKMRGKRHIFGGRTVVRNALFLAANAAVFFTKEDNVFKQMYHRLKTAGKKHKEAIIAVAHKMLKIAHSLLKNQEMWKNKLNTFA